MERILTDKRNVSQSAKDYMQGNYKEEMQGLKVRDIIDDFILWMAAKGITGTFGGNDGYQTVKGKAGQIIGYFIRYKRLHPEYVKMKAVLRIGEKELAKAYGYASTASWLNSVNREKRICEIVEVWLVIGKYCEAKRV